MGSVFRAKYKYKGSERQTETWYIAYADSNGKWIRKRAGVTKEQAKDALRKAEMDVLNEKNGLPTFSTSVTKLADLLNGYIEARRQRTRGDYPKQVRKDLGRLFTFCRVQFLKQLTPALVEKYISHCMDGGLAAATANRTLTRLKAMLNWAVRTQVIPYNPILGVQRAQGEKRRIRRALSEDEISRLLLAALEGPQRRGLRRYQNRPRKDGSFKPADIPTEVYEQWIDEGRNNVLAYRIMIETGLRLNEARSLTWDDLDLHAGNLTTRPHWEGNKNGKQETLPIAPGLLNELRIWRDDHPGAENLPVVKLSSRALRCFNEDLLKAGIAKRVRVPDAKGKMKWRIEKRDASGRVVDLHALRHTFGTRLGRMPGIDPKSVQTLMRHSDPRLTFGVYVHSDKARLSAAVALLPSITVAPTQRHTSKGEPGSSKSTG